MSRDHFYQPKWNRSFLDVGYWLLAPFVVATALVLVLFAVVHFVAKSVVYNVTSAIRDRKSRYRA